MTDTTFDGLASSRVSLRDRVRAHPLATFFLLACAFSWSLWPVHAVRADILPILPCGPFVAAVTVLGLTRGRDGVRELLRSMRHWRVAPRWWAAAILVPVVLTVAAGALNVALGAPMPSTAALGGWTNVLPTALLILVVPIVGGAWEEPGWRGYALPRLLEHRSPVVASLVLGAWWAGWHLPLFLIGQILWSDVALMLAASVVFTWLVLGAGGSVLIAMVFHAMNNAVSGEYVSQLFSGADAVRQGWMLVLVWTFAATVLVRRGRLSA